MVYLIVSNILLLIAVLILFAFNYLSNEDLKKIKKQIVTKDDLISFTANLKIRDDLIKSDFKGKVKNKKLLKEMFNHYVNCGISLSGNYYGGYKDTMMQIIDYDFHNIEYLLERLKEFEEKQETLDKYQIKRERK